MHVLELITSSTDSIETEASVIVCCWNIYS